MNYHSIKMFNALITGWKLATTNCSGYARKRFLSCSNVLRTQSPAPTPEKDSKAVPSEKEIQMRRPLSNFDRKVLVWSGKFKSVDEIPLNVAHDTLDRARDRFRVKVCIYMMFLTIFCCIIQIIRGKRAAARGESVSQYNIDWHKANNEAAAAEEAKKNK